MEKVVEKHKINETEKQKKFIIKQNENYKKENDINGLDEQQNEIIDWQKNQSTNIIILTPQQIKNGINNNKQKQQKSHQKNNYYNKRPRGNKYGRGRGHGRGRGRGHRRGRGGFYGRGRGHRGGGFGGRGYRGYNKY